MQTLLVITFCFSLAASFLLSGMEAGVFALSRLRVRQLKRAGDARAETLHSYLEHPEDFLWTILVGNTLANFGAMSVMLVGLWRWLEGQRIVFVASLVVAAVLFYALCELLPKTLFRLYPNRLCLRLARPFGTLHGALRPLVALVAWFAQGLLRWTGGRRFTGHLFGNRDELRLVMQESAHVLTSEERAMINRVLDLQNITVRQIAIPLVKTVMVPEQERVAEVLRLCRERNLTRLLVWRSEGEQQRIIGLVNLKSLLYQAELDPNQPAGNFLKPALYLDGETRLEVALRQMRRTGQRLAIVLGEDRTELGVVSLQDILQVIFGEVSL